jgi:hypothetical protein
MDERDGHGLIKENCTATRLTCEGGRAFWNPSHPAALDANHIYRVLPPQMLVTFFYFYIKERQIFYDGGSISQAYLSLIILIIIPAIRFALCEQKKKMLCVGVTSIFWLIWLCHNDIVFNEKWMYFVASNFQMYLLASFLGNFQRYLLASFLDIDAKRDTEGTMV